MDEIKEFLTRETPLQVWTIIFMYWWPFIVSLLFSLHKHDK